MEIFIGIAVLVFFALFLVNLSESSVKPETLKQKTKEEYELELEEMKRNDPKFKVVITLQNGTKLKTQPFESWGYVFKHDNYPDPHTYYIKFRSSLDEANRFKESRQDYVKGNLTVPYHNFKELEVVPI